MGIGGHEEPGVVRDVDAQNTLFRSLYVELRRFAAVVAPQEMDPDDLLQEALSRTLAVHALTELDNAAGYLRVVMVRVASHERRRLGRHRRAVRRVVVTENVDLPTYPSDAVGLDGLDPLDRAVLYLTVVEDLPIDVAARMLRRTPAALRMRKHRALRAVRRALEQETSDDV